ncbi:hypothetical protein FF1_030008 [Malus domestica]
MFEPPLKLLVRNQLPGTPSLIARPALLSKYPLSQHLILLGKIPHLSGEQKRRVKMMHRSMWRQAQYIHVLIIRYFFKNKSISYHRGRKQRYLISCFFPIFSFVLALACRTRRKEAISRNLKLYVRSGTDCPKPLPGCLPRFALEYSSSTVNGSRISSANISKQLIWCWLFTLKLSSMDEWLKSDALKDHLKAKGCAPLRLGERNKQRRTQHDEPEQIIMAEHPSR